MSAVPEPRDPGSHGLDGERLARAGDYLGRYVDEGKLAGWQLVVARGGAVVWHQCRGLADVEAGIWTAPSGDKVAWFTDPDGNTLSLTEFAAA